MSVLSRLAYGSLTSAMMIFSCGMALAGSWPTVQSYPQVSSPTLIANNTTSYTISTTISDKDGYNDIIDIRVLINYCEAAQDQSKARAYMAWATSDAEITRYGGAWSMNTAAGGGRWGFATDAWGGVSYMPPLTCSTTVSGSASGAIGSRTATWTFRARPYFARNPLINDGDVWACDSTNQIIGWKENPGGEFDVVSAACVNYSATPSAPVITNPTTNTLAVAINPADSDLDLYCIRISPASAASRQFVQADGSLSGLPAFLSKSAWGTKTVTGLASDTAYAFKVRANRNDSGWCPSTWGEPASGRTAILTHTIDYTAPGKPIAKGIAGMNVLPWKLSAQPWADYMATSYNTSMRFSADGYNWKTRTAQWDSSTWSTLQALRDARDRNSYVQILANIRGIGTGNGSTWVYTDQTPETLAALAVDWVFYCNNILQNKRKGDPLNAREQAVLDSMSWGTDDKLPAPGEVPLPKVTYWEIGNEPEGPYPPPALTVADYAARYKIISQAMVAEDPTIKVGPCIMSADSGNAWLDAVLSDPANRVDFVAYHPYGLLYYVTKTQSAAVLNADDLNTILNYARQHQFDRKQKIVDRLTANNRPATTPLISSECNPSSWEGTYYYQLNRTMAHGLGVPETIFAYADMGFVASQYWDLPNNGGSATIELPGFKMYKALQSYLGDRLLDTFTEQDFRLYTTLDTQSGRLVIWALNLSEYNDKSARFQLPGDSSAVSIQQRRLAAVSGNTSLITKNNSADPSENIKWTVTDLTGSVNPADFSVTFPHATLTMLVLDRPFLSLPDGTQVSMTGKAVTAAYSFEGYLYLEQDNRTYGIRAEGSFGGIEPGDRASVAGTMDTVTPDGVMLSERVISAQSIVGTPGGGNIQPVAMTCRSIGGGPTKYSAGVNDGFGLNNIGLLVRIAAKVTDRYDVEYMYVDDGSNVSDIYGDSGVLVRCPDTSSLSNGDMVIVTGVVEGSVPAGWPTNRRYIRALPIGGVIPITR